MRPKFLPSWYDRLFAGKLKRAGRFGIMVVLEETRFGTAKFRVSFTAGDDVELLTFNHIPALKVGESASLAFTIPYEIRIEK